MLGKFIRRFRFARRTAPVLSTGMRAFLPVLLCLAFCLRAFAADFKNDTDDSWMQHYYVRPQPGRFEAEVKKLQAAGALKSEDAMPPLASFFSRLFAAATQEQLAAWLKVVSALPEKNRQVFLVALRWAGTPSATDALRTIAAGKGRAAEYAAKLLTADVPPDLTKLTAPAPEELDMCWGAFFATGDAAYALTVIRCAALPEKPGNINISRQAAQWSLKSLCQTHAKLREIRDEFQKTATPGERKVLEELFKK